MMDEKYFGKLVSVLDEYSVVINKGEKDDVQVGQEFLIIELGEMIIDPDSNEELEQLEIVKGRTVVTHVQQKIATMKSCEYKKETDIKEIKKVSSRGGLAFSGFGLQNTVTESIKPGEKSLKAINSPKVGDFVIKALTKA